MDRVTGRVAVLLVLLPVMDALQPARVTPLARATSVPRSSGAPHPKLVASSAAEEEVVERLSIDQYLDRAAGGWGRFQDVLLTKLGANYAFIAADNLVGVFLVESLSHTSDWALTLTQEQSLKSFFYRNRREASAYLRRTSLPLRLTDQRLPRPQSAASAVSY
jgi:hypothetical protein